MRQHHHTVVYSAFNATTGSPPQPKDILILNSFADMFVTIRNIAGTTPSLTVSVVELIDQRLSLPYDGQTANFVVGKRLKGQYSEARGLIVADTDAGVTGTLELKQVQGTFYDNEPIVHEDATAGAAFVNSATGGDHVHTENGEYGNSGALNAVGSTKIDLVVPLTGSPATAHLHPIVAREFRLKFTLGGTVTDLDFYVELLQSDGA